MVLPSSVDFFFVLVVVCSCKQSAFEWFICGLAGSNLPPKIYKIRPVCVRKIKRQPQQTQGDTSRHVMQIMYLEAEAKEIYCGFFFGGFVLSCGSHAKQNIIKSESEILGYIFA